MKGVPRDLAEARRSQPLLHLRACRGFVLVDVLKAVVAPLPGFGGGHDVAREADGLGDLSGPPGMQQQQLAALGVGWVGAWEPGCDPMGSWLVLGSQLQTRFVECRVGCWSSGMGLPLAQGLPTVCNSIS